MVGTGSGILTHTHTHVHSERRKKANLCANSLGRCCNHVAIVVVVVAHLNQAATFRRPSRQMSSIRHFVAHSLYVCVWVLLGCCPHHNCFAKLLKNKKKERPGGTKVFLRKILKHSPQIGINPRFSAQTHPKANSWPVARFVLDGQPTNQQVLLTPSVTIRRCLCVCWLLCPFPLLVKCSAAGSVIQTLNQNPSGGRFKEIDERRGVLWCACKNASNLHTAHLISCGRTYSNGDRMLLAAQRGGSLLIAQYVTKPYHNWINDHSSPPLDIFYAHH